MSVLTIYFCGTCSNRFDQFNRKYWNGELISTLAGHDPGREFVDWIVIDGPGSGNLQADELFVRPGNHSRRLGKLLGRGWKENVAHALQVIKGQSLWQRAKLSAADHDRLKAEGIAIPDAKKRHFFAKDFAARKVSPQALQQQIIKQLRPSRFPTQVNLVGWSRGGISCHMLANEMLADPQLMSIPVNIFAVEPVPGLFNVQEKRVSLGANVRNYVGFYARDERSFGFAGVIPTMTSGTQTYLYPLPGRHATLVGVAALNGKCGAGALVEPGLIVRHTAEVFLDKWGVKLAKRLNLSDRELADYLFAINSDDHKYLAMRRLSYTLITEGSSTERLLRHGLGKIEFSHMLDQRLPLAMPYKLNRSFSRG
ncbi:hypothetical protein [Pseudomonas sp. NPDC089401]|uniref:hypothetical protein n=1 Tax=Pseudomonas sp. NPDC089401 TaxID=3364462 RepID=UPI0038308BB2